MKTDFRIFFKLNKKRKYGFYGNFMYFSLGHIPRNFNLNTLLFAKLQNLMY